MRVDLVKSLNIKSIDSSGIPYKKTSISFKSQKDEFVSLPEVISGSLTKEETDEILTTINTSKPISSGYTSNIYKLGNKIVKVPVIKEYPSEYAETMAKQQNLREYYALDKIQQIDPEIAVKPFGVIRNKDTHYIVEELVEGVHPEKHKLTKEHLIDLFSKFYKLDSNGIVNSDLQTGNIFLLDDKKTKLIDFGSFSFIDSNGNNLGIDYIPYQYVKEDMATIAESPARFIKTFFAPKNRDIKNVMDNPFLNSLSNASNFELRTMYSHLLDGSEENPLEFFKQYLQLKSENYHKPLKSFLENLSFESIDKTKIPIDELELAEIDLKYAIRYEELIKKVLENPTDDVIKAELAKMQLRMTLNLHDSLGSPVSNPQKLKAAYSQLINTLEKGMQNSEGDKKDYFSQTLNGFKAKFKDYNFEPGQVEIPDNENLLKVLFNKVVETGENTKNVLTESVSRNKSKTGILIAAGIAAGIGVISYIAFKQKKTNNKQQSSNIQTNINPLNNTPNIFLEFKVNK